MTRNNTHLTVRIASIEDASKLSPMLSYIENQPISPTQVMQRVCAAHAAETPFIAEQGSKIVGFAFVRLVPTISSDQPYAEITELYVEDETKRGTISKALTKKIEALAREKGATHLVLLTGLRNIPTKNLYRALGYRDYALALRKTLRIRNPG
ncbi:MAG: GNAT family N-acetyltransferase [Anaerolineales bacterium]